MPARFHDAATSPLLDHTTAMIGPRRTAAVPIALREQGPAHGDRPAVDRAATATIQIELASFADVEALAPTAITRRYPAPGARDAEPSRLALIELADPALPWLYSPRPAAGAPLRPWLVLVVGRETDDGLRLEDAGTPAEVTLHPPLLGSLPPLAESHKWAHVQVVEGDTTARLLAPVVLAPETDYVAAVVPAFRAGGGAIEDAWSPGETSPVRLPAYASWRFRTGAADDFLALALALAPQPAPTGLGRVAVRVARLPLARRLLAGGALVAPAPPPADAEPSAADPWPAVSALPREVAEDLRGLREYPDRDARGRPLLTLPAYGGPWSSPGAEPTWAEEVNGDPRLRGAAGLGTRLAVEAQDELVDLTLKRMGPIREAEQRVRHLALGISAARSLWRRRLPADAAGRVFLLGPAMGRVVTEHGPLLDLVAAPERPLPRALFSSAAQRVLRRGPNRTALARPGLRAADAVQVVARCPAPAPEPAGLPTIRPARLDPGRAIDPTLLAAMVAPAGAATPEDAARLSTLADAVDALAARARGTGGRAESGTWRVASPPVTLRVSWLSEPGPTEPFPREHAATVRVELAGISSPAEDQAELRAVALPDVGVPARWRLVAEIAGRSAVLHAGGAGALLALPRPQGSRTPLAQLTLEAVDRPGLARSASVPVSLAPFTLALEAAPVAWRDGAAEMEADVTSRVVNLADSTAGLAGALELGAAGGETGLPATIGPFATAVATRRATLATQADGTRAEVRLRVGGQVTGTVTLERGAEEPITLAGSPWLAPLAVAAGSSAKATPDAAERWSRIAPWVDAVGAHGLVDAPLDGTPLEGVSPADLAALVDALAASGPPAPAQRPCRPVSVDALARALTAAFDPTSDSARAIGRVSSTIAGRPADAGLEPIGICPDVPTPLWELLRRHRGEWLLAGLGAVEPNAVIGLATHPAFIESLMVGANQQLLGELAWRGLPIHPRCSPLRRFWGRLDPATGAPVADIAAIARWGDTPLGHDSHADEEGGAALVVLLRSELFQRYPATLLYLLPAGDPASPSFEDPDSAHALARVYPSFQGTIGPDVTFFGFGSVSPEAARGHWIVLEEPSRGFRFWGRKATAGGAPEEVLASALAATGGGAALAARTLSDPLRIMIPGPRILPPPGAPTP